MKVAPPSPGENELREKLLLKSSRQTRCGCIFFFKQGSDGSLKIFSPAKPKFTPIATGAFFANNYTVEDLIVNV